MSKSQELPGFWEKRKILFGPKTTPETMRQTGRRFMEAGRLDDALEFLERTDASDEVRQILRVAQERGDTALFLRAKKALREEPTEEELLAIARAAQAAGRLSMACVALVKAGRQEEAERLRGELAAQAAPAAKALGLSSAGSEDSKAKTSQ